jgi:hypothetical protein
VRHLFGFLIPAAASAEAYTFSQHLVVAVVSGLFGVVGVTLAAWLRRKDGDE